MAYRKKSPRTRRPRVARRRKARATRRATVREYASMKQTINLVNDQNNVIYKTEGVCLDAFDRAVQVARAYQQFRITKLEVEFKPFVDTFTNSTTQSIPYLHYLIVKNDNIDAGTFNQLRDAGAKPRRFDDKIVKVSWKPGVQNQVIGEDVLGAPAVMAWAETRTSPWLATSYQPATDALLWSPSKVPHKGLLYGVQEDYSTVTQYYDISLTAHFEFRKPMSMNATVPTAPTPKNVRDKAE